MRGMAKVIPFEERAVATLRDRLGAVESANEDLIAFARGHSGATASIHAAVLALMEADSVDALFDIVTKAWPRILGHAFVTISNRASTLSASINARTAAWIDAVAPEWPRAKAIRSSFALSTAPRRSRRVATARSSNGMTFAMPRIVARQG